MGIIINILLGICIVWSIVSITALIYLTRPSVKERISDFIANKMADKLSDIVYGEKRINRKNTKYIYR